MMYMYSIQIILWTFFTDKSGAYIDSAYQALFSRRAGDEARYSHNCLARIKKNDLATSDIPIPIHLSVFTHCMVFYASH